MNPTASNKRECYVIDGSNVCRSFDPSKPISLAVLLAVLIALRKRGAEFICFFDATIHHVLRETGDETVVAVFKELVAALGDRFVVVPAGTSADENILSYADRKGLPVISNDRFADYFDSYQWIQQDRARRITGLVVDGEVTIKALNIFNCIPSDVSAAKDELLRPQGESVPQAKGGRIPKPGNIVSNELLLAEQTQVADKSQSPPKPTLSLAEQQRERAKQKQERREKHQRNEQKNRDKELRKEQKREADKQKEKQTSKQHQPATPSPSPVKQQQSAKPDPSQAKPSPPHTEQKPPAEQQAKPSKPEKQVVTVKSPITVTDLAQAIGVKPHCIIQKLFAFQVLANINTRISKMHAADISYQLGYTLNIEKKSSP
jgi:hypothetical protein